jgi:hypothetical protein
MALQNFFDELRSPRRGLLSFALGSSSRLRTSGDEGAGRPVAEDPRIRRSVSSAASLDEFSFEDAFAGGDGGADSVVGGDKSSWSAPEGVTRREHQHQQQHGPRNIQQQQQQQQHTSCLLDGLIPLNFFLRTDIVQLVPGDSSRALFPPPPLSLAEEKKQQEKEEESPDAAESPEGSGAAVTPKRWSIVIGGRLVEPLPHAPHLLAECAYWKGVPVEEMLKVFPPFPAASSEEQKSPHEELSDELLQAAGEENKEIARLAHFCLCAMSMQWKRAILSCRRQPPSCRCCAFGLWPGEMQGRIMWRYASVCFCDCLSVCLSADSLIVLTLTGSSLCNLLVL